jgi:DNA-binding protein H-NS
LKAQIAKLEKKAADLQKKEVAVVAAKVRALINEYGLTAEHLGLTGKTPKTQSAGIRIKTRIAKAPAGVPKYRDPVSGKTWTGKGKAPGWIHHGLKQGKSKDDFLIGKKSPATAVTKKITKPAKVAKATKSVASAKVAKPAKAVTAKPAKVTKAAAPVRKPVTKKPAVAARKPVTRAAAPTPAT